MLTVINYSNEIRFLNETLHKTALKTDDSRESESFD